MAFGLTGQFSWQTMQGGVHGPGQAAAAVDERGADAHRAAARERLQAPAFLEAQRPDGGRGAELAAGDAGVLAAARPDAEVQPRRPQPLQTALEAGGPDHVGRADAHALAALDAARQELLLRERAGRPDEIRVPVGAGGGAQPQGRRGEHAGRGREHEPPAAQVGQQGLAFGRRAGAVGDGPVLAVVQAVHAHHALADLDPSGRAAGALAVAFAFQAACAALPRAADAPERKPAEQAEQRAERADEAAIEPRHPEVERERGRKDRGDQAGPVVEAGQGESARAPLRSASGSRTRLTERCTSGSGSSSPISRVPEPSGARAAAARKAART